MHAVYNKESGVILRFVDSANIGLQCAPGEAYVECSDTTATHIEGPGKTPVTRERAVPRCSEEAVVRRMRMHRNQLLFGSDWTQLPDAPLTTEQKQAWAEYRQQLRDFPETCDPNNPAWPTPPK